MRKCEHCTKPLPSDSPRSRRFCPREEGKPRCSDLARAIQRRAKSILPEHDLTAYLLCRAPADAVGFRIRLESEKGTVWVGPRPGQKYHCLAYGHKRSGDFYALTESPRVPKNAEYFVDFVDKYGLMLLPRDRAPLVKLRATGGSFEERPSPTQREQQRYRDLGLPPPPRRRRICEVAKDLGMVSTQLLRELAELGYRYRSIQNSLEPSMVEQILRQYTERNLRGSVEKPSLGSTKRPSAQLPPGNGSAKEKSAPSVPHHGAPELGELLPVPPLIQPEHSMARGEIKGIVQSAQQDEASALDEVTQITADIETISSQVDFACGVPTKSKAEK